MRSATLPREPVSSPRKPYEEEDVRSMTDHQGAIAPGFYDHELDSALENERHAPDWGADDVFATSPRRRFRKSHRRHEGEGDSWLSRTDELAMARIRRDGADRRPDHARAVNAGASASSTGAATFDGAAPGRDGAAPGPDRAIATPVPEVTESARAAADAVVRAAAESADEIHFESVAARSAGRRTVVVTGRPEGEPPVRPLRTERRRPPRTVAEHVGGRPDRIAAWAFGLGLTLILVAVTTADAAPL